MWEWIWIGWNKKKLLQLICGNDIVEIGKKNCNNYGNGIAKNGEKKSGSEIWRRVKEKKKCHVHNIFTTFSQ